MSGWVVFLASQGLLTSVTLGVLKREGIISINSAQIQNPSIRTVFDGAVDLGENIAHRAEKLYISLTEK